MRRLANSFCTSKSEASRTAAKAVGCNAVGAGREKSSSPRMILLAAVTACRMTWRISAA
jgi:hypothetical protein